MKMKIKTYILLVFAIVFGIIIVMGYNYYDRKTKEHNFFFVIQEGDIEKVKKYLKSNKDINNIRTKNGNTALHIAACNNRLKIAKLLIANKIDPNLKNSGYSTALIWAIQNNNYKMAKLFLDSGVPATQKVLRYMPAIHFAAQWGYVDIIKLLVKRGADVNRVYWEDVTPLSKAVSGDHVEAVKLLLKLGAKVDKQSLLFASQKKDKTILNILKANIEQKHNTKSDLGNLKNKDKS